MADKYPRHEQCDYTGLEIKADYFTGEFNGEFTGTIDAADVSGLGSLATKSTVTSADITDGTIVNADISASAAIARTKLAANGVATLTDSSGGTSGGNTVAAVPAVTASTGADTTAADLTSTNAAITAIKNDIATLAAKLNALIAAA